MANQLALFVGRQQYIDQLRLALDNHQSVTFVTGEAGIGKSAILNEFYNQLKNENISANYFVGFHNKEKGFRCSTNLSICICSRKPVGMDQRNRTVRRSNQ